MGFMFNPEIGKDIKPIGESISMFVRTIGLIFASNGLFPRNHPALMNEPGARLTMGEIISTSYKGINFTREGMPKAILFFAVVGCLVFSALAIITALLLAFTGTAYAAEPGASSSGGIFQAPSPETDLALQWIDYLFKGGTITFAGDKIQQSQTIAEALRVALAIYSNAILVMGSIILMYHLLAMVAETAHSGVPLGRRASQVWAPIRLVVAIALLVPMSGQLNVGQSIMIQTAKWGSGLASNTWSVFLNTAKDKMRETKEPKLPLVEKVVEDLLVMKACTYAYNNLLSTSGNIATVGAVAVTGGWLIAGLVMAAFPPLLIGLVVAATVFTLYTLWDRYRVGYSSGEENSDRVGKFGNPTRAMCGSFSVPMGKKIQYQPSYANGLYEANWNIIDGIAKDEGDSNPFNVAAKKVIIYTLGVNAINSSNTEVFPSKEDLKTATDYYRARLKEAMDAAQSAMDNDKSFDKVVEYSTKDGWVSAGSWFNTISRLQMNLAEVVEGSLPKTLSPLDSNSELNNGTATTLDNVAHKTGYLSTVKKALNLYLNALRSGPAMELSEDGILAQKGSAASAASAGFDPDAEPSSGAGSSVINGFLTFLDWAGRLFGVWPDTQANCMNGDASATSTGAEANTQNCVLWPLKTANPLAELTWIGHNNLRLGFELLFYGMITKTAGLVAGLVAGFIGGTAVEPGLGTAVFAVGGALIGAGLQAVAGLIITFGFIFIFTGVMIGFVLPMVPFVRFFFNIMTWLIVLFEAVVSMPLFALAHLNPNGEGLPGDMARQGYFFIFSILLRPVLMVFGLVAGLLLFFISITFLNKMFYIATIGTGASLGGFGTLAKFLFSIMYMVLAYICANTCFKAISHFPDHALNWMNARGPSTKDLGDQSTFQTVMTASAGYIADKGLGKLPGAFDGMAKAGADAAAKMKMKKQGPGLEGNNASHNP
ncbi:MAG: DotA/TraY family protein [Alphaproteobacteria bacterium]|nr:DotA/TraY family protein [Alphaproteobacteria bacterium]